MDLVDVYTAAQDSVHTYRIPALTVTRQGTLLAFAEARQRGAGDAGDIDLVVRRSTDGGDSWCRRTTPTTPVAGTSLTALTARTRGSRMMAVTRGRSAALPVPPPTNPPWLN